MSVYAQPGSNPNFSTLSSWAETDVLKAYDLNILQPYMARDFKNAITREAFCDVCTTVISMWYDCDFIDIENVEEIKNIIDNSNFSGFDDTGVWYVEFCAKLGIVSGKGNGKFEPEMAITREEAAKMLYNTLEIASPVLKNYRENNSNGIFLPHVFEDGTKIQSWARNEINVVYNLGIMMGNPKNEFEPQGTYTKEQAICTFLRLYNAYKNPDENTMPDPELYPIGKYEKFIYANYDGSCYLDMAHQWGEEQDKYEPEYIDAFGNLYSAKEKGYVYPVNNDYMEVLTSVGVGVHGESIINKNKEDILSVDTVCNIDGDYANIMDYGCKVYNLKTGQQVTVDGETVDIKSMGCGMYSAYSEKKGVCYLNSDMKPVTDWGYMSTDGKFLNNYYAAVKPDGTVNAINTDGDIIKTRKIDLNRYMVYDISGTNIILQINTTGDRDILRVVSGIYIKGFENAEFMPNGEINVKQSGEKYILDLEGKIKYSYKEKGYSDIYGCNYYNGFYLGSKTSNTEPYDPAPFDVLDTNGNVLVTGLMQDYIVSDGGGVFCGKRNNYELVIFDSNGTVLGVIKTGQAITRIDFINGLVRTESDGIHTYYLPNGEKADFINKMINN